MDAFLGADKPAIVKVGGDESDYQQSMCGSCGQEAIGSSSTDALFLTVYRRGQERDDYFGALCRDCGDKYISEWKLGL